MRAADILSSEVRERIARLDVIAQTLAEGPISGLHKSPFHGFSIEFAQHREYTWGDELRHVDWKVFARTDRYYVKQYEEETNLRAMMMVDASESMLYQGEDASCTKYEYAATLAVGLSFLLIRQQDTCGMVLFDDEERTRIPPSASPAQLRLMAKTLAEIELRGEHGSPPIFHRLADELGRRGMVFIFSDLLYPTEEFLEGLRHLRHRGHEVVVFHVLDFDELDFPFTDTTRFEGLEGQTTLQADPRSLRESYVNLFSEFLEKVEAGCQNARVDYLRCETSTPPGTLLGRYLNGRKQRMRRRGG